jgi:glycosyltransferase involved in cell wall biosynthesis
MASNSERATLVVNFGGPELDHLARWLASAGRLAAFARPYVNRDRWWERTLARLPLMGRIYARTFGRRRVEDPRVLALTVEAGVGGDLAAALLGRLKFLPPQMRRALVFRCHELVRLAVSRNAERFAAKVDAVVGFPGFSAGAFAAVARRPGGLAVLNYPIAHHREHRRMMREEAERQPAFAPTWVGFDDWTPEYEAQIDGEIDRADIILLGSSYARDSFVAQGIDPGKLRVVEYGVDLELFHPAAAPTAPRPFTAVFSGQIGQRKGLSYLLDGYRAFAHEDTALRLIGNFAGSSAPLKPYAGLYAHVPHMTRPDLAEAYRNSDVLVFPSLLEGMGLVVLEAMACGIPAIVTPNGPGDLVRDGIDGFVVPVRDAHAIADRLERLYRDPELRTQMGRNARARAEHYGWDAYARRVADVLTAGA